MLKDVEVVTTERSGGFRNNQKDDMCRDPLGSST
jgi:hypothetical protein